MTEPTRAAGSPAGAVVAGLLVLLAAGVVAAVLLLTLARSGEPLWDLEVYRGAISTWLDGGNLYDYRLDHPAREGGFPFTYPPFAALTMVPLVWIPTDAAELLWSLGSVALTILMAAVVVARAPRSGQTWLGPDPDRARLVGFTAVGVVLLLLTLPGVHNMVLGQISFLIAALMLVDVAGLTPRRIRGVLVGLAAALKLTPLIAVPYFAVTRQWRAAVIATATFLGATVLAWAVYPSGSVAYWTVQLLDTSRVGESATVQNKSIMGLLARWDATAASATVLWVLLATAVAAVALWQARRQYLAGQQLAAALIVGCAAVAASPVSWPHHQVWIILVAVYLLLQRRAVLMALGVAIVLVNLVGSPLMGQEVVPLTADDPLLLSLGRELPTLSCVAVCLLGLPLPSRRPTDPASRGTMALAEPTGSAGGG